MCCWRSPPMPTRTCNRKEGKTLKNQITTLSRLGAYHRENGGENQDALCFRSGRRRLTITLADGVSACREAKTGAKIASEALAALFEKKGEVFLSFTPEDAANLALSHVLYELRQQAGAAGKPTEDYSSTLAGVLFDRKTRQLLYFSLGDSLILATGGGKCRILAAPADSTHGCCVTTTQDAAAAVRVGREDGAFLDHVMLCSDGAWHLMLEKDRFHPEVAELLAAGDYDALKTWLAARDGFDDCSFIAVKL